MSKSMLSAPHFQSVEVAPQYLENSGVGVRHRSLPCAFCDGEPVILTKKLAVTAVASQRAARKDFSATTKNVMDSKSHIKFNVWLQAFFLMASSKKGISSHQLHRALGNITYKSAWFLTHRIREAMRAGC